MTELKPVPQIRQPDRDVVAQLEWLLEQARAGDVRGLIYCTFKTGSKNYGYGYSGDIDLSAFAVGVRLLDKQLGELIDGAEEAADT